MSRAEQPSRRTVLTVAVAAAVATGAAPAAAATRPGVATDAADPARTPDRLVDNRAWITYADWRGGAAEGTRARAGARPGLELGTPAGTADYTDPHTGTTATWAYGTWTSPSTDSPFPPPRSSPRGTPTRRPVPGSRSNCRARTPTARTRRGT